MDVLSRTSLRVLVVGLAVSSLAATAPHPCNRKCQRGEKPMTCEYNFTIEWYLTLSKACYDCPFNMADCARPDCAAADGLMRPMIAVNRQMPGPAIEVCENDHVVVWVKNHLEDGEATSVHWHGIHQVGTPYADGVGHVTQCPIGLKETFKYDFKASPAGTHWYHSHTGIQLADGLNGAFVVRQPQDLDPNGAQYDHDLSEHVIMVNDWVSSFQSTMSQYLYLMHDYYDAKMISGLFNGKRRHFNVSTRNIIKSNRTHAQTPLEVIKVKKDQRYRLRFIGAMGNCPFMISFEKHRLTVIATDGAPVQPRVLDSFIMHPGERYDFVLNADQSVGNYWLKAVGLGDCRSQELVVDAILRYNGAPDADPAGDPEYYMTPGVMLNPLLMDWTPEEQNRVFGYNQTWLNIHELRHAGPDTDYTDEKVDLKLYLGMDYNNNDNTFFNKKDIYPVPSLPNMKAHFTPTLDNITFDLPPIPILSQPEDIDETWFCNRSSIGDHNECLKDLCLCTHLIRVPKNYVVELIMFNIGTYFKEQGHPMHIHGYNYRVLGNAKVSGILHRDVVTRMDKEGKLPRNFINPSIKDTLHIADGGYAIIRFKADNPGLWFFHCHTDSHLLQGKALVFKVGDYSDFPPVPDPYPRCGDYRFGNAKKRPEPQKSTNGSPTTSASGTALPLAVISLYFLLFSQLFY